MPGSWETQDLTHVNTSLSIQALCQAEGTQITFPHKHCRPFLQWASSPVYLFRSSHDPFPSTVKRFENKSFVGIALCLRILNKPGRQITYGFHTKHTSDRRHTNTPSSLEHQSCLSEMLFSTRARDTDATDLGKMGPHVYTSPHRRAL